MRIRPVWWIGVIVYLIYGAIIVNIWLLVGADYRNLAARDTIIEQLIVPLGLGTVFIVSALSYLGWWLPVMREEQRGQPEWIQWVVIPLMLGFIIINVSATNWSAIAPNHLMLLIAACLMVGFNEEVLTRGVLVLGWRGSTSNEIYVWFCGTFLYGLMHLPNAFFGIGLIGGVLQFAFTFLLGCGFYIIRRLTGALVVPIALHGAWDFAALSHQTSGAEGAALARTFQFGTYLVSIFLVILVLLADRRAKQERD